MPDFEPTDVLLHELKVKARYQARTLNRRRDARAQMEVPGYWIAAKDNQEAQADALVADAVISLTTTRGELEAAGAGPAILAAIDSVIGG